MIEKVRRALDLDAEMGHLCIEFAHCQRLASTSSPCAACISAVADGKANHAAIAEFRLSLTRWGAFLPDSRHARIDATIRGMARSGRLPPVRASSRQRNFQTACFQLWADPVGTGGHGA